jgi:toxin-antitoxin system PIN domain toxin
VKLLDVNLLIYAVDESSPRHAGAKAWIEQTFAGPETVGLPWVVLLAFVRLTTKAALFQTPLSVEEALDLVDGWLAQPAVSTVHPGRRHAAILRDLLTAVGAGGNLATDAHLAALALEIGAELFSCDADFSRFAGLNWTDPLRVT